MESVNRLSQLFQDPMDGTMARVAIFFSLYRPQYIPGVFFFLISIIIFDSSISPFSSCIAFGKRIEV
jgi:hypothetical protein